MKEEPIDTLLEGNAMNLTALEQRNMLSHCYYLIYRTYLDCWPANDSTQSPTEAKKGANYIWWDLIHTGNATLRWTEVTQRCRSPNLGVIKIIDAIKE